MGFSYGSNMKQNRQNCSSCAVYGYSHEKKKTNRIESISEEQKILQRILNEEKKHIEQGLSAEFPPLPAVSVSQC